MGGGGGGGGGGSYERTPDTLRSLDTVEIILGLCEGPIQGLENGAKSFYIGNTPLMAPGGTLNFQDFDLAVYKGSPSGQPISPQLGGTASSISVGTQLDQNVPIVRQLDVAAVTHIDIRLAVQALYAQDDNGIYSSSMTFLFKFKRTIDPSWNTPKYAKTLTIAGKTSSTYAKEIRFKMPLVNADGVFWQVQITKTSPDSDGDELTSVVAWESLQQVINGPVSYENLAVAHLIGRASNQFSSIPNFWGIYKLLQIKVPTNYNPDTRVYSGVWDGTFKVAWTNNPAWILYDFVTNETYGLSYTKPMHMDKYAVYAAGQWCDQLVPDGKGGTQPRYRFNALLNTPRPAWEQARFIAGTFNAALIDDNVGTLILRVDDNGDATHMFTPEMVTGEGFQYSYTDKNARYNDITVSFVNPALNWEEDRRRVYDQDSIDKYGRIPFDFIAHGCIFEAEALRKAYYKMNTALTETEIVTFTTNRLGQVVEPFDIILVSDPNMGYGLTGRVKSFTSSTVTLRDSVYLEFGVTYKIRFRTPDGVIERTLTTPSTGNKTVLTVSPSLPGNFPEFCAFSIEEAAGEGAGAPKPYRVVRVEEGENYDQVTITAIEVNRNKFEDSENLVVSEDTDYGGPGDPLDIPSPLNVEFDDVYDKGSDSVWTIVYPEFDPVYKYYSGEFDVWSRIDGSSGSFEKQQVFYGNTLVNHRSGPHEFKILPKNLLGQTPPLGKVESFYHTVAEPSEIGRPPLPPINLSVVATIRGFILSWECPPGETNYIHHYKIMEGLDEETAVLLADNIRDPLYAVDPMTKRNYNMFVYSSSISGVLSETAAEISFSNTAPPAPENFQAYVAYETISLTFDRNAAIDIIGYRIQYRKLGDNDWIDMNPNGLFDSGEPNTAYEFRVAAIDQLTSTLNDEVWSTPISARTRSTLDVEQGLDEVRSSSTPNMIRNGSFERNLTNWTVE